VDTGLARPLSHQPFSSLTSAQDGNHSSDSMGLGEDDSLSPGCDCFVEPVTYKMGQIPGALATGLGHRPSGEIG